MDTEVVVVVAEAEGAEEKEEEEDTEDMKMSQCAARDNGWRKCGTQRKRGAMHARASGRP
jgi:hypothetical protein